MNKKLLLIFIGIFVSTCVFSQRNILKYSGTVIDAVENPQRQLFQDSCKKWASNFPLFFPAINFFDFQVKGDINKPMVGFIFSQDLDPYLQNLQNGTGKTNRINLESRITPFMLRFRTNKKNNSEFSIYTQLRVSNQTTVKNEFFNFYFRGNGPFKGQTLAGVFDTETKFQAFTSLNLGYRTEVSKKIAVGGTLHLINGIANVSADIQNSSLFTEQNLEYIDLKARGNIKSSFDIQNPDFESVQKDFTSFKNLGAGLSIGTQYKVNEKFLVDFAAKDIGFIRWTGKDAAVYSFDKNVRYEGEDVIDGSNNQDSILKYLFKFDINQSRGSFISYLPTNFELGFNYKPNKFLRGSFIVGNTLGFSDVDFSFIGDVKILGGLHFVALSTISTNSFNSLGAEFLIRSKGFDFYLGSEKLFNTYNFFNAIQPEDIKYSLGADLHMGMAFRFGRCKKTTPDRVERVIKPQDADLDGVLDFMDDCPFVPGPISNKGCPILDTDGDGVLDSVDKCPTLKGPIQNNGCPYEDQDGDGVLDKDDQCPTLAGPISNKGCPFQDTDGDGVLDSLDDCPNVPGLIELKGCPAPKKVELDVKEQEILNTAFTNLLFKSGNSAIDPSSFPALNSLANLLIQKSNFKLIVEGHTDYLGDAVKNLTLSENRALAVKEYLVKKGIDPIRIAALGYGSERPVATNDTKEGRAKNRRVEFTVVE